MFLHHHGRSFKFIALASFLLIALCVAPTAQAAQAKPGAACTKLGQSNGQGKSKLTCKRVGGRLKWVRTSLPKIVPPTLAPSESPTLTPTPTTVQYVDAVDRFTTELALLPDERQTSSVELKIVEQPGVREALTSATRVGLESAIALYSRLGLSIPPRILVLIGRDNAWIMQQLVEAKCARTVVNVTSSSAMPGKCADGFVAIATVYGGSTAYTGLVYQMEMPHELFHLWQLNSATIGTSISGSPRWLNEGAPQVFARLNWTVQNPSKSTQAWFDEWYRIHRPDLFSMCKGVTAAEMEGMDKPWPHPQWCAYSKGQLVIEFLISRIGIDKFRKLVLTRGPGGLAGFATHFESVTGETLSDFYAAADAYATGRGW